MDRFIDGLWALLLILYGVSVFIWPNPADIIPWEISHGGSVLWNPLVGIVSISFGVYYLVKLFKQGRGGNNEIIDERIDLITIEFPMIISPVDRLQKYENPLNIFLKNNSIGYVSGGGTPVGEYVGIGSQIDIACNDGAVNINRIYDFVCESNYPKGTILKFNNNTNVISLSV